MARYFAKINKDNVVETVIVAEPEFINSGKVGDPKNWIETFMDGKERKNYAGIGYSFDKERNAFIPKKEFVSWVLDEEKAVWKAPKEKPVIEKKEDVLLSWNETEKNWEETTLINNL